MPDSGSGKVPTDRSAERVYFCSPLLVCRLVIVLFLGSQAVHAQESGTSPRHQLDTISVYATLSPHSTFDVPAIVSNIDVDAPGNVLSGDMSDLFQFMPGVEVDGGPRRTGQTISIRGFDDRAIITLIDGRRQNFGSTHDGRFYVDTALLKSVEVVKGASSAIYGGGAIGGLVAFETKDAADLLAPGETRGWLTSFGYRSANDEYSPIITAFGLSGGWDLLGSVAYRDSGDIEQGDGGELDTEDQVLSGLFKAGYTFNDFHTLKFTAQLLNNDGQEPNNGSGVVTPSNPLVDKEVDDKQFSLKYVFEDPANDWLDLNLHVYYNDTEVEETDRAPSFRAGRKQSREMETWGFTAGNQTRFALSEMHRHVVSYGFEIYEDEQTGERVGCPVADASCNARGTRDGVPDADATNYGFYLQDEIALDTEIGEFLIIPAVRYDSYESDDEDGNSQDEDDISPKLSLSYKPAGNVMFFASWAEAFRAPDLTELYAQGQHFPGQTTEICPALPPRGPGCPPVPLIPIVLFPDNNFVTNPDLKPEKVETYELGFGFSFDDLFAPNGKGEIKGSWYTSDGEDFIASQVDIRAGTTINRNIPDADVEGWELEARYELHPVTARFGLSYVKAEDDDTGEYLDNNVPLTLVTDVGYRLDSIDGIVGWRGRFARENDRVSADNEPTSGYGVNDLYYRWAPDSEAWDSMTVDLGVENVFDKAYKKRFATVVEEGRSYVARISYQW